MKKVIFVLSTIVILFLAACSNNAPAEKSECCEKETKTVLPKLPPEWVKDATIYEVNIRQYTEDGTFEAFAKELPRLKKLGVDILWLMPIHPIGEKNRKGTLGSYYSVKDYYGINPEFGNMQDFKNLVKKIHEMDMYIIIDMVANHTSWDNPMIENHPEWYTRDSIGNFVSPFDWSDVVDLNFDNPELCDYMTEMLEFWVRDVDIDGYRCDVAGMVPVEFWANARDSLDAIKPIFMLAEDGEINVLKNGFDANYAWSQMHLQNQVAKGEENVEVLYNYLKELSSQVTPTTFKMNFTTNHDENSWNGTIKERMGDAWQVFAVYNTTEPGMPLIYSGQEAGNEKRLEFFEKDLIPWQDHPAKELLTKLNQLKKDNPALWTPPFGGEIKLIENNHPTKVLSFLRKKDDNKVLTICNFSDKPLEIKLELCKGCTINFLDYFSGKKEQVTGASLFNLDAWGYKVLVD